TTAGVRLTTAPQRSGSAETVTSAGHVISGASAFSRMMTCVKVYTAIGLHSFSIVQVRSSTRHTSLVSLMSTSFQSTLTLRHTASSVSSIGLLSMISGSRPAPQLLTTTVSSGHVISVSVNGSGLLNVIVCEQVSALPEPSVAIQVLTMVPT